MATQRAKPQDFTGRQRQKLAEQHAEVVRAREDQIAMAQVAQAELDDSVHDVVGDRQVTEEVNGEVRYVEAPAKVIRVNSTIEDMTFGVGNIYTFQEGQQYRVPADLAKYLDDLGYVWHAVSVVMGAAAVLPLVRHFFS